MGCKKFFDQNIFADDLRPKLFQSEVVHSSAGLDHFMSPPDPFSDV